MESGSNFATRLLDHGFAICDTIYDAGDVAALREQIDRAAVPEAIARRSADLFAIRQVLQAIPGLVPALFNDRLRRLLEPVAGPDWFVVKSLYFDKPPASNWYVACHQDLTVSVDRKLEGAGFSHWTIKQNQHAAQPPVALLENILTVRIHLDATDEANGALRVIPGSHRYGILRPEAIDWSATDEVSCNVPEGGVMLMKPLLLHRSHRTTNHQRRRVLHLELSNQELPAGLRWSERTAVC